ncbi:MAG TPA: ATP-binding protein [Nitrosopumilaceae archaeon]|jgi:hypothetical protein|nr:ATP-binding protein [Nitrosopumilaceae archaeon]
MITLIVGERGVGKTTIAKAIQQGMQQEGWDSILIDLNWPSQLNLALVHEIQNRSTGDNRRYNNWLIVLDDKDQWSGPYHQLITITQPGDSDAT